MFVTRLLSFVGTGLVLTLIAFVSILAVFHGVKSGYDLCAAALAATSYCAWLPNGVEANNAAQLVAAIASAVIAAISALAAAYATSRIYERRETLRDAERRIATVHMMAAEISTFAEQLCSSLNSARLVERPSRLSVPVSTFKPILPTQAMYTQLAGDIAMLGPQVARSVSGFYAQMRRLAEKAETSYLGPRFLGFVVRRTAQALLDLNQCANGAESNAALTPRTIQKVRRTLVYLQSEAFQGESWNPSSPAARFGTDVAGEIEALTRRWSDLSALVKTTEEDEED